MSAFYHPGAIQLGHLRKFMKAHAFQTLLPDQRIVANGPLEGGAKVRAARAADGALALVYSPQGARFTLAAADETADARPVLVMRRSGVHSIRS